MWIYLRHYLNLKVIFSLFTEFKTVGPYGIVWETGQYKGPLSFWITLGLLTSLQAMNIFWLMCILRVIYRVIRYDVVEDDRSEAEESELEDAPTAEKAAANGAASGVARATGSEAAVSGSTKRR